MSFQYDPASLGLSPQDIVGEISPVLKEQAKTINDMMTDKDFKKNMTNPGFAAIFQFQLGLLNNQTLMMSQITSSIYTLLKELIQNVR